jgi:hemerythrin-like domain-containing protein
MSATDDLRTDHRAIERMLAILETAAQRIDQGVRVPPDVFRQGVDFVRNFADRCHHAKEEENLFPRMEARGVPRDGGPIGVMLFEHDEGRAYIGDRGRRRCLRGGDEAAGRPMPATRRLRGPAAGTSRKGTRPLSDGGRGAERG